MLTVLAHEGEPIAPHDLWTAWRPDGALLAVAILTAVLYLRGTRESDARTVRFFAGLGVILIATMSPLEAMSGSLASAHMVQHLILMLVAAPLLATGAPIERIMLGLGTPVRRTAGRVRRWARLTPSNTTLLRSPVLVGIAVIVVTWWWHGSVPYGAALDVSIVHHIEHGSFIAVYAWFWWVVFGSARRRPSPSGVVLIFGVMMSNVLLGGLMTFARVPWYEGYAGSTSPWGLTHLADQQLAGVLMWVPPSVIFLPAALWLLVESLGLNRREPHPQPGPEPSSPVSVDDTGPADTMVSPPE